MKDSNGNSDQLLAVLLIGVVDSHKHPNEWSWSNRAGQCVGSFQRRLDGHPAALKTPCASVLKSAFIACYYFFGSDVRKLRACVRLQRSSFDSWPRCFLMSTSECKREQWIALDSMYSALSLKGRKTVDCNADSEWVNFRRRCTAAS